MLQIVYQNELMPPSNRRLIGVWYSTFYIPHLMFTNTHREWAVTWYHKW